MKNTDPGGDKDGNKRKADDNEEDRCPGYDPGNSLGCRGASDVAEWARREQVSRATFAARNFARILYALSTGIGIFEKEIIKTAFRNAWEELETEEPDDA